MNHGAAFGSCLSIRVGRPIQGKVPEIVRGPSRVELKTVSDTDESGNCH